jgi:hypothetical protein
MRSISRAIVASAISLPLVLAGAGMATASGGGGHHHKPHGNEVKNTCVYYSCNSWWQNETNVLNFGIIG